MSDNLVNPFFNCLWLGCTLFLLRLHVRKLFAQLSLFLCLFFLELVLELLPKLEGYRMFLVYDDQFVNALEHLVEVFFETCDVFDDAAHLYDLLVTQKEEPREDLSFILYVL